MATPKLIPDFKEFLRLLNSEKIEYLLIGGYAVALYGYIRPTKDMDVWISVHPDNVTRLIAALVKFGFAAGSLRPADFTGTQTVFRMGLPPNRLEIITSISGVAFEGAYPRRQMMNVDGVEIPVISYDDLKANKTSSERLKDRADVQELERSRTRRGNNPSGRA